LVRIQKDGLVYRLGYGRAGYSTGQDTAGLVRIESVQVMIQMDGYSTGEDTKGWVVFRSAYRRKGYLNKG
jgi:hypothetical protein